MKHMMSFGQVEFHAGENGIFPSFRLSLLLSPLQHKICS